MQGLHHAAYYGHDECMRLLLPTCRDQMEARDKSGGTPLIMAARRGHFSCVQVCVYSQQLDDDDCFFVYLNLIAVNCIHAHFMNRTLQVRSFYSGMSAGFYSFSYCAPIKF